MYLGGNSLSPLILSTIGGEVVDSIIRLRRECGIFQSEVITCESCKFDHKWIFVSVIVNLFVKFNYLKV